ncbi:MAG: hypothetical protein KDD66_02665 [Bdellovibrionales bacterium]|nr:hypothetical protein [Bdellovibrionales bacterium]
MIGRKLTSLSRFALFLCFALQSQASADEGYVPEAGPSTIGCLNVDYNDSEQAGEEEQYELPFGEQLEPKSDDDFGLLDYLTLDPWYPTKLGQFYSQGTSNGCFTISLLNANIAAHPFIDGWPVTRGYGRLFKTFMECVTSKMGNNWGDGVEIGSERYFDVLECKKQAVEWLLHRESEISTHVVLFNGHDPLQTPPPVNYINYHQSIKTLCTEMKRALEQDGAADGKTGAVQLFVAFPEVNPDGTLAPNPDGSIDITGGHAVAVSQIECEPVMRMTIIDSNRVQRPRHVTVNEQGILDPSGLMITGANIETNSVPLGTNPL